MASLHVAIGEQGKQLVVKGCHLSTVGSRSNMLTTEFVQHNARIMRITLHEQHTHATSLAAKA
jgi:hypothetical protein